MHLSHHILRGLGLTQATTLAVHPITRFANISFENLAIRANGQILTTTTHPNASIYQVDPLGIIPPTLVYNFPDIGGAQGIVEGEPDIFYVASGTLAKLNEPLNTTPDSYSISEVDMSGVSVMPDGRMMKKPMVKRVANLTGAALLNGIDFAGPGSDNLLVADSFRGLIWNVNVDTGVVGVALNDSTTKGSTPTGPTFTGVNGLKVQNGTLYWTSTGRGAMYKVAVDECGNVPRDQVPTLVAEGLTCDDLVLDEEGNAYIAGPLDVLTKVTPDGEKQVIAGTFNSTSSTLEGPSAARFGRLESDRWSLYITTNGGLSPNVPGTQGISRVDLV